MLQSITTKSLVELPNRKGMKIWEYKSLTMWNHLVVQQWTACDLFSLLSLRGYYSRDSNRLLSNGPEKEPFWNKFITRCTYHQPICKHFTALKITWIQLPKSSPCIGGLIQRMAISTRNYKNEKRSPQTILCKRRPDSNDPENNFTCSLSSCGIVDILLPEQPSKPQKQDDYP